MYGPFTNELLVGRVLKERRADAFVSTKCGLLVGEQHIVANGRPGYVKRACDASLRRLQTDVIDLYQLHRADPEVPVEETWGAMAELVAAGKVRALGLCAVGARAARGGARAPRDAYDATSGSWSGCSRSSRSARAGGAVGVVAGGAGGAAAVVRGARGGLPGGDAAGQRLPDRDAHAGAGLRAGGRTGPASAVHGRDDGGEPAAGGGAAAGRAAARGRRSRRRRWRWRGCWRRGRMWCRCRGRSGSAGRRRTRGRRS